MEEICKCLNNQDKEGFQAAFEEKIKELNELKGKNIQEYNVEIQHYSKLLQQGKDLLPVRIYKLMSLQLIPKLQTKPSDIKKFHFSSKLKAKAPKKDEVETSEIAALREWTLQNVSDQSVTLQSDGEEIRFSNLTNCKIQIDGKVPAMYISGLKNCTIHSENVEGSIFIEKANNCTLFFSCKQLRIHKSFHTDFFVSVSSGPIIEDCTEVRFAPRGTEKDGPWDKVEDFKWLKKTSSPNWSIIPEEERKPLSVN